VLLISKLEDVEVSNEKEIKELSEQLEKYTLENKHISARFEDIKAVAVQK